MQRRILVSTESVDTRKLQLLQFGRDYRAFKELNPSKVARIPQDLKQRARDLCQAGAKLEDLAKVTSLQMQTVKRWIDIVDPKPRKTREKKPTKKATVATPPTAVEPHLPSHGSKDLGAETWIKIRIAGKELEVARQDFWNLIHEFGQV